MQITMKVQMNKQLMITAKSINNQIRMWNRMKQVKIRMRTENE